MLTVDVRIDVDNHVESAMQKKNNRWVDSSKKKSQFRLKKESAEIIKILNIIFKTDLQIGCQMPQTSNWILYNTFNLIYIYIIILISVSKDLVITLEGE